MQVLINNDLFLDIKDILPQYENAPKEIIIENYQDIIALNQIKNVKAINIMGLEETVKSINLSNLKGVESLQISYNFGLEKIAGLDKLPKLKCINYVKRESDNCYNILFNNILEQINLPFLLSQDQSHLSLSIFAIPILKKKYPNFFADFQAYANEISFCDITETFLQGEVYSTCSFTEAYEADTIIDKWILENISPQMTNIEKFAKIYEYVIGINYDYAANENKENHRIACSALQTLLRKKGICVGYAQLLKYICAKCDLQCEYVKASQRDNYNIVSNEESPFLEVVPKENDNSKLGNSIVPNHAIVRFSPDGTNWLFSDSTSDSLFVRIAQKQNKKLRKWPTFCLPMKEMELYNSPCMYDYNGNKIILNSQLTLDTSTEIENIENNIFSQSNQQKYH